MTAPTPAPDPALPPPPAATKGTGLHRTVVVTEVLWAEKDYMGRDWLESPSALGQETTDGSACGTTWVLDDREVSPSDMTRLLEAQGADPDFIDHEDLCSFCHESLDDGEGYDGFCGTCADLIESHHSGNHSTHSQCPVCHGVSVVWT